MKKTLSYLHSQVHSLCSSIEAAVAEDKTESLLALETGLTELLKDIQLLQDGIHVDALVEVEPSYSIEEEKFLAEQDAAFSKAKEAEDP